MRRSTLLCDHCGAPVTYRAPFCPYCRAAQSWDAHVVLRRGPTIAAVDLSRAPLPTRTSQPSKAQIVQGGTMLEPSAAKIQRGTFDWDVRDACVIVRGTALDEGGVFGVAMRMHKHGNADTGYDLQVYPAFRSFRLRRPLWLKGKLYDDVLHGWTHAPGVRGMGQENEIELRAADSVFQVVINGELVATVLDAAYGYGAPGWVVASESDVSPARVLLSSITVASVS